MSAQPTQTAKVEGEPHDPQTEEMIGARGEKLLPSRLSLTLLNDAQHRAVTHTDGPLLVFAGAGSGKTRVITHRIVHLIESERIDPCRILAVTFTNKAADEMKTRLSSMLGEWLSGRLWVGTFHSVCAKLLRRYGGPVSVPPHFLIYDSSDQKALMQRIVRELNLDEKRYSAKALLGVLHGHKQEGREPKDLPSFSHAEKVLKQVYSLYEKKLLDAQALDFEDLILKTLKLLRSDSEESKKLKQMFSHVLVDEFQDTNMTQYEVLRELTSCTRNLCVVGDDDQSIYAWRGADIQNIRGFSKDYSDASVVKLEQNYRSTGNIVRAALGVISASKTREPKELWTSQEQGSKVRVLSLETEREEGRYVAEAIRQALNEGISADEIAVFYRIHAQSRVLEESLRAHGVAYDVVGGLKFFDRMEIKDVLAYLRVVVNPRSDVDLLRIVNTPSRKIGEVTIQKWSDMATSWGVSLCEALAKILSFDDDREIKKVKRRSSQNENVNIPLFRSFDPFDRPHLSDEEVSLEDQKTDIKDDLVDAYSKQTVQHFSSIFKSSSKKKLAEFYTLLLELQKKSQACTPSMMLDLVLKQTGYLDSLKNQDSVENEARLENLAELANSVRDYETMVEASGETPTLLGFLERVTLSTDADKTNKEARIKLMTVHSAKGLEFDLVFVCGMEEDMFPYRGMNDPSSFNREQLEEERRLAYVAITRAKKYLVLLSVKMRHIFAGVRYGSLSRFLADLPDEAVAYFDVSPSSRKNTTFISELSSTSSEITPNEYNPRQWRKLQLDAAAAVRKRTGKNSVYQGDGDPLFDHEVALDSFGDEGEIKPGRRVAHPRFGVGEVVKVIAGGDPAVVAFFPGWGEMKVLARFLRPG